MQKRWKSNDLLPSSKAHTEHRVSSRKGWYGNCEDTMLMSRDQIAQSNQAKGKIDGLRKLVSLVQKEVSLRNGLSSDMKKLGDQRVNMNFNNSKQLVNKGKEVLLKKVISEKGFNGLQYLKIDKVFMYEDEILTKMI